MQKLINVLNKRNFCFRKMWSLFPTFFGFLISGEPDKYLIGLFWPYVRFPNLSSVINNCGAYFFRVLFFCFVLLDGQFSLEKKSKEKRRIKMRKENVFKRKNRSSLFASSICLSSVYVWVMKTVCTCVFVLSSLLTFILTRGFF